MHLDITAVKWVLYGYTTFFTGIVVSFPISAADFFPISHISKNIHFLVFKSIFSGRFIGFFQNCNEIFAIHIRKSFRSHFGTILTQRQIFNLFIGVIIVNIAN